MSGKQRLDHVTNLEEVFLSRDFGKAPPQRIARDSVQTVAASTSAVSGPPRVGSLTQRTRRSAAVVAMSVAAGLLITLGLTSAMKGSPTKHHFYSALAPRGAGSPTVLPHGLPPSAGTSPISGLSAGNPNESLPATTTTPIVAPSTTEPAGSSTPTAGLASTARAALVAAVVPDAASSSSPSAASPEPSVPNRSAKLANIPAEPTSLRAAIKPLTDSQPTVAASHALSSLLGGHATSTLAPPLPIAPCGGNGACGLTAHDPPTTHATPARPQAHSDGQLPVPPHGPPMAPRPGANHSGNGDHRGFGGH